MNSEIRWYKGKYKVEVILKSKGNWRVKALEQVCFGSNISPFPIKMHVGYEFTTVPRLLWRKPRGYKILVLDIGCGKYSTVHQFFPSAQIIGIDINHDSNAHVLMDMQYLAFKDQVFKAVYSRHVIEHARNDLQALSEMYRVLQSGGKLVLIVPNADCHRQKLLQFFRYLLKPQDHGWINLLFHTDRTHYREYFYNQLLFLLKTAQFKIQEISFYGLLFSVVFQALISGRLREKINKIKAGKYSHSIEMIAVKEINANG